MIEVTSDLLCTKLTKRAPDAHKGDFGRLTIVAGSRGMVGAPMMATLAAMRTGSGLTTLAAPEQVVSCVSAHLMEAMTLPLLETPQGGLDDRCGEMLLPHLQTQTACVVGCGLRVTEHIKRIVENIVENTKCKLLFDADALNAITERPEILHHCVQTPIVTPHPGEMARLCHLQISSVLSNPAKLAQTFAQTYGCVTVLKGHRTVIASPDGMLYHNTTGNAGLSKGGSGDILSGMIGAFLAQGLSALDAAVCAVWIHGAAADRLAERMALTGMLARDVIDEIPFVMKALNL